MKLFCLKLKYTYYRKKSKLNLGLILKYQPNRTNGFWEIAVDYSLYFIVFANILIKLIRKIGKMCPLIFIFANILPILHEYKFQTKILCKIKVLLKGYSLKIGELLTKININKHILPIFLINSINKLAKTVKSFNGSFNGNFFQWQFLKNRCPIWLKFEK